MILLMHDADAPTFPSSTGHLNDDADKDAGGSSIVGSNEPAGIVVPEVIQRTAAAKREFYYLINTGEVVEGPQGSWQHRMGPYPTRDAAAAALQTARNRNALWEAQTKAYQET